MGYATHLGPWLLGTVKETSGTATGTVRNTGCTIVAQNKTVAFGDASASTAFVVPAGSLITAVQLIQTTTFTSGTTGTFTVLLNGTQIGQASVTTGTAGILTLTPATAARAALFYNVGATDATMTYTSATMTAGAGTLVMAYMVRNADGSAFPASV